MNLFAVSVIHLPHEVLIVMTFCCSARKLNEIWKAASEPHFMSVERPASAVWYSDYWEFLKRVAVSRNVLFCCNFHLVTGERGWDDFRWSARGNKRISMSLLVGECSGTCVFAGRSSCASYRKALDREELSVDLLRGRRCSPRSPQLYLACSRQFRRSDEFWKTSHGLKFVL